MGYEILISEEAKFDIEYSFLYYRDQAGKKVADNFMKAFRIAVKTISKNPFFRVRYDDFRAIPMKNYPFLIFFVVDEVSRIVVVSRVFHTSQNPIKYP